MESLSSLITKLEKNHYSTKKDRDDRYMATFDLLNWLTEPTSTVDDADLELRLKNIIIQLLDNVSCDVSELAVRCLAPSVRKMNIVRVAEMSSQLFEKILNGTDRYQDTSSIALKVVVAEVSTQSIAQRNNPILTLINGIMEEFSGVQFIVLGTVI